MASIPFFAKRFISGLTFEDTIPTIESLNQQGICVTLDVLGENIRQKEQSVVFLKEYKEIIQRIYKQNLNCYVSVKLTMLGLDIDNDFCYSNLSELMSTADQYNVRVALDMEGSAYTEKTLSFYERINKEFKNCEIVLQAYLYRTESDVERVLASNGRLRLCKGAYKEGPDKAIQDMNMIIENYKKLVTKLLLQGQRVCIASHDDKIIHFCINFIKENNISPDRYEFQMLYGLRKKTWNHLRRMGHNVTIYVPYGADWKAYYSRRLSERKENIFFVLRNFFKS